MDSRAKQVDEEGQSTEPADAPDRRSIESVHGLGCMFVCTCVHVKCVCVCVCARVCLCLNLRLCLTIDLL